MRPLLATLLCTSLFSFLPAACSHGHEEELAVGTPTGATCPTPQTLTYANFGRAFLQAYCLRCHSQAVTGAARGGAPTDHNFDGLTDVQSMAEHIDGMAGAGATVANAAMPPSDPRPTLVDRKKLAEWLACGAP